MPPPSSSPILLPLFLLLCPDVWSYEAPEDKQDVFARKACPAFLTFTNAAYLSGVTVELPCQCKPQEIQSVVWFFREPLGSSKETRALTDHHGNKLLDTKRVPHSGDLRSRFSIRLFSLLIYRAGPDDSGIYICGSAHKDYFYGYDLDIQEARTLSITPSSASRRVEVPVFYLSHPADNVLTLGCPGAQPNMAVAWDRGSEPIYRSEHSALNLSAMPPRLLIDTGHHLVFQPAQTQDSGVYHCWLQGHQAAEIRLLVYVHLGRGQSVTSHPDFPAALRTVLGSYAAMTAVFCLLVFGRAGVKHLRDSGETHVD
uniref:Family with sequence similarity 187 member A n=1 Tax=Sander lucioperca TaxID=283035 RepID=A0A8D0AT21_SANLU